MKTTRLIPPILAFALLSSCASVSVKNERRGARPPAGKPTTIYIADFGTDKTLCRVAGADGANLEEFKKKTTGMLASYLVKGIHRHVGPAQRTSNPSALPKDGWLLSGHFIRINTGSRVLRSGVGLGAGGTKMETQVQVRDLASGGEPFLTFETTGGSNAMPGLLTNPGTTAALSMTTQAMMGVTDDCARTSRMITGTLNEYLVDKGWLPKSKRYSAKRLGKYRLIHEQYTN